jgi:hypothetical protein
VSDFGQPPETETADLEEARYTIRQLRRERDRLAFERDAAEVAGRVQLIEFCRTVAAEQAERGDLGAAARWLGKATAISQQSRRDPRLAEAPELDVSRDEARLRLWKFIEQARAKPLPFSERGPDQRILVTLILTNREQAAFAEQALWPCLLAKGNLPALARSVQLVLQIFAAAETEEVLSNSLHIEGIGQLCRIHLATLPDRTAAEADERQQHDGDLAALCLQQARAVGAGLLILRPDMILSEDVLAQVAEWAEGGASAVATVLPGLDAGPALERLRERIDGDRLALPAAELAEFALGALGSRTLAHLASADNERHFPEQRQLLWVTRSGIVFRSADQHPLFISAELARTARPGWSRSGPSLLGGLQHRDFTAVRVNADLNACGIYRLEQKAHFPAASVRFEASSFAERFWRHGTDFDRWLFEQPAYLRGNAGPIGMMLGEAELRKEEAAIAAALLLASHDRGGA